MRHDFGMAQRPWPQRYKVVLSPPDAASRSFTVATWHDREKAVEIAGREPHSPNQPADVEVTDLGPVNQDERGLARPEPGDLIDRHEW